MVGRSEYTPPEAGEDILAWLTTVYSQQLQWELELVRNHSWGFTLDQFMSFRWVCREQVQEELEALHNNHKRSILGETI